MLILHKTECGTAEKKKPHVHSASIFSKGCGFAVSACSV